LATTWSRRPASPGDCLVTNAIAHCCTVDDVVGLGSRQVGTTSAAGGRRDAPRSDLNGRSSLTSVVVHSGRGARSAKERASGHAARRVAGGSAHGRRRGRQVSHGFDCEVVEGRMGEPFRELPGC
jgi:hypothetical protein